MVISSYGPGYSQEPKADGLTKKGRHGLKVSPDRHKDLNILRQR